MNKLMNRTIDVCIFNTEIIVFVIENINWSIEDEIIKDKIRTVQKPVILVINKIDKLHNKKILPSYINIFSKKMRFYKILPICAKNGINIDLLHDTIREVLPKNKHHFLNNKNKTIHSNKFFISEVIREKLVNSFDDEIPYFINVEIEKFYIDNLGTYNIYALVLIENLRQKKIVIGNKGNKLKHINIQIRKKIESLFNAKVNLYLWVKIQPNWINDLEFLKKLKYFDNVQKVF